MNKIKAILLSSLCTSTLGYGQSYVADYTVNPFTSGKATDQDDSYWLASKYGRTGVVASDPFGGSNADEESFYKINSSAHTTLFQNIGDKASITTAFYSDATTGTGSKESTVFMSLAPGVSVLIGDLGGGSGNKGVYFGVGSGTVNAAAPSFALTTDVWVDSFLEATYVGNNGAGIATFDYKLTLSGGMSGTTQPVV